MNVCLLFRSDRTSCSGSVCLSVCSTIKNHSYFSKFVHNSINCYIIQLQHHSTAAALHHCSMIALQYQSTAASKLCSIISVQNYSTAATLESSTISLQHQSTAASEHCSIRKLQHHISAEL